MSRDKFQIGISVAEVFGRLKKLKNIKTDTELAHFLGVKQSTFANWKVRNKIPYDILIPICDKENINFNWLLTGQGEMFIKPTDKEDEVLSPELIEALKSHPTIEKIVLLLKDMDDSKIQEIFNLVQEKKLLMELLKERYKQTA